MVEQVVEGVKVLHGKGHAGVITSTEALIANAEHYERVPTPPAEIGVRGGKAGPGRGNKTVADSHGFKPTNQLSSNSQERILRRLARDAPEVLERVKAGEFKSARAAAIEAGIIRPVPTIRLVDDPAKVAAALRKHLSPEQLEALKQLL